MTGAAVRVMDLRGSVVSGRPEKLARLDWATDSRNDDPRGVGMPMQRIARAMLGLALAMHAVLGCCWHHAHAANSRAGDAASHSECGCQHHQHGPTQTEPGSQHGGDRQTPECCVHDSCVYLRAERAPELDLAGCFDLLPPCQVFAVDPIVDAPLRAAPDERTFPADSTPLFLRLGVLLI